MARTYERLPIQDSSFLAFETATTHMHLGGVSIFETGSLATTEGGIDIDRIRAHIGSRLHLIPRYRQRLAFIPLQSHPVWVDDQHFDLHYHVRHTSLPRPGDERQLKRLTARIMSQALDRGKPLWEAWVVEGLEGGRFALVVKTHHCMADGISAVDLLTVLLNTSGDEALDAPPRWRPRPTPTPGQLLRDELVRSAAAPFRFARSVSELLRRPDGLRTEVVGSLGGVWQTITAGLAGAAPTPLNRPVGPHRRFDWLTLDLEVAKQIKNRLGGTVNDVVLATVAGAVGTFLRRQGVDVHGLDYRAVVPVSVRTAEERGITSNRASAWLTPLPVGERDPRRRLMKIRTRTAHLKATKQALGPWALLQVAEWAVPVLVSLGIRLTEWLHPYNLIVTNIPGPPVPIYLLGSRMLAGYPLVPLFENQGLGVAIFSYVGTLHVGVNADLDQVPALHEFTRALEESFAELHVAAGVTAPDAGAAPIRASG